MSADAKLSNFYNKRYQFKALDQKTLDEYEYKPDIVDISQITEWTGDKEVTISPKRFKIKEKQAGKRIINNNSGEGSVCGDCDINKIN